MTRLMVGTMTISKLSTITFTILLISSLLELYSRALRIWGRVKINKLQTPILNSSTSKSKRWLLCSVWDSKNLTKPHLLVWDLWLNSQTVSPLRMKISAKSRSNCTNHTSWDLWRERSQTWNRRMSSRPNVRTAAIKRLRDLLYLKTT